MNDYTEDFEPIGTAELGETESTWARVPAVDPEELKGERRVKREMKMQMGNSALRTVGYFERPDEIPNLLRRIADFWEEEDRRQPRDPGGAA